MILNNTYASFINLDHRKDRLQHMEAELNRVKINAVRTRGMLPNEYTGGAAYVQVMANRTKGAIGCHFSQVTVMKEALKQGKHALVMEDDLVFCDDIQSRLEHITEFTNNHEWDVFWLGSTFHLNPTWHKSNNGTHLHPDMKHKCNCKLNKDVEKTDDERIVRTFGCWSTYAYIVNVNSIEKILSMFDEKIHLSMGIDWLFILLQPQLKTYSYIPGCVKQFDNQSDIGTGITKFSAFAGLGRYWFQPHVKYFDRATLLNFNLHL